MAALALAGVVGIVIGVSLGLMAIVAILLVHLRPLGWLLLIVSVVFLLWGHL